MLFRSGSVETVKEQVLAEFGDFYQEDKESFLTDIPMDAGQALRVELGVDWQRRSLEVRSWKVYIQEEYEIDQSVRVWSGTE